MVEDNFTQNKTFSQYVLLDKDNPEQNEMIQHIANVMRKRIESFNPHRREILVEIKANIAYLVGEQDIELIGDNIVSTPRERIFGAVVNVILPAVQKDMAVATSRPPAFDIVPGGNDDDDKATAIVCKKAYKHLQRMVGKDLKRGEAVLWYDISGVGWRKTFWNPNATVKGVNPPSFDENGQKIPSHIPELEVGAAIVEGEVEIVPIPTSQLIYDYRLDDLTKLPWIIHAKKVRSSWVLSTFGPEIHTRLSSQITRDSSDEKQFETNILNRFTELFDNENQRMVTTKLFDAANVQLKADHEIDYYEYWHIPTASNPTGAYSIMLGTQVVSHHPFPIEQYPHGELPFTPVNPMCVTGATSGGICRISQARPLQRKINRLAAQLDENIDVMGNAIIFTPSSAKLKFKTLDNHAGNIIEYDGPMNKPHRESGVPMNPQAFSHIQFYKNALDEIFAFHGAMKGQPPKNVDSGKGIQALQQSDIEHLGPIVEAFEEGDQRVLYQALVLMAANYQKGRMVNVVGTDYEWALYEWDPAQLQGKFNVIVKHRSSMPLDRDATAQQSFNLWQSGLLGDPQDPSLRVWVMDQMELGNKEAILQKHSKHKNFAMKEFSMALENLKTIQVPEGITKEGLAQLVAQYTFVPSINPFDDHMIHIEYHSEYLLDKYWKFKSTGNPLYIELLNNMGLHTAQHQQIVMERQAAAEQKALMREMLVKGKTPQQIMLSKMKFEPKSEKGAKT